MALQDGERYLAEIVNSDIIKSPKSGTYGWEVKFAVVDEGEGIKGQVVGCVKWITPNAMEHTVKAMEAVGYDLEGSGFDLAPLAAKTDDNPRGGALLGARAKITVEEDEYTTDSGAVRKQMKVAWINDPDAGFGGVRGQELDTLSKGLRQAIMQGTSFPRAEGEKHEPGSESGGATPARTASPGADIPPDDDIPF